MRTFTARGGRVRKAGKAMSRDDIADLIAAGDVGVNHRADIAAELSGGALGPRLELSAQIGAFLAIDLDQGLAERQLHALVALQARRQGRRRRRGGCRRGRPHRAPPWWCRRRHGDAPRKRRRRPARRGRIPAAAMPDRRSAERTASCAQKISATCGAIVERASALMRAITSGLISGGGMPLGWCRPAASVQISASVSESTGRYQTML